MRVCPLLLTSTVFAMVSMVQADETPKSVVTHVSKLRSIAVGLGRKFLVATAEPCRRGRGTVKVLDRFVDNPRAAGRSEKP